MGVSEIVQFAVIGTCALVAGGITMLAVKGWHRERYLCGDCKYNSLEMCSKQERPKALECTAYVAKQVKK